MAVFLTLLTLSCPAFAQNTNSRKLKPPPEGEQQPPSTPTVSRTFCPSLNQELRLVRSRESSSHRDRTTSSHPTFAWIVSSPDGAEVKGELRLYDVTDPNDPQFVIRPIELPKEPGLATYTLPNSVPGLMANKSYMVQISLFCDPDRPEANPRFERSYFEVVGIPKSFVIRLENARDREEKIALFYEANLWFNALEEVLNWAEERKLEALASLTQSDELKRLLGLSRERHHSPDRPAQNH